MRWILPFLLLTIQPLRAATGDITVREILSDGWRIRLTIEGFTTGATVAAMGGTNGTTPTATTGYLTVVSQGYTGTTLGTKTRTVYLGKVMRFPWDTRAIPGTLTGTFVRHENVTSNTGIIGVMVGDMSSGTTLHLTSLSATPTGSDTTWTGATGSFAASGAGAFLTNPTLGVPNSAGSPDQRLNGAGNLVIEFPLSEYIYLDDNTGAGKSGTAPTLTIPAGFITSAGNPNVALTNASVTQSSTVAYRTVKFWWMWPDYQRFTDQIYPRAFAWAPHGSAGKPGIECVVFSASDGTNTVTGDPVYWLEKDHSMPVTEFRDQPSHGGGACVPTFIDILTTAASTPAALTQGAACSLNATVYPQIGDTPYATASNTLLPESLYGTQSFLCDRTGAYGRTYAIVDDTGTDPAGFLVADDAGKSVGNGTDPTADVNSNYLTIARAARAIRNYNSSIRGRDDVGGGTVFLKAGNYPGLGKIVTGGYGSVPATYISIEPYPGLARSDVSINSEFGDNDISDRVRLYNLTFASVANDTIAEVLQLWFDQVHINVPSGAGAIRATGGISYLTHCKLTDFNQGFKNTLATQSWPIIRGCEFSGFDNDIHAVGVVAGNYQLTKYGANARFTDRVASYTGPDGTPLFAFNNIIGWDGLTSSNCVNFGALSEPDPIGFDVLQNVIEETVEASSPGVGDLGAGEVANNTPINNCDVSNNTFVGQRMQFAYNSGLTTSAILKPRYYWEVKNNVWDVLGLKSDNFSTAVNNDGVRQGNWPLFFGTMMRGNVNVENADIAGSFAPYFLGINSHDGTGLTHNSDWTKFKNRQSSRGPVTLPVAPGLGDYSLQVDSPLRNTQTNEGFVLPYDMAGRRRRATDAAGAYSQHRTVGRFTF